MSDVLRFPTRRHTRASTLVDAKTANRSAVSPADRAVRVDNTDLHHSAGIEFLCHHLETEFGCAPTSVAMASRVGQSSMTERNDFMLHSLGQSVLKSKANTSHDLKGHNVLQSGMGKSQPSTEFKRDFTFRVRSARQARGLTQTQMAALLGISQGVYKQYEGRTLMPHELIPSFCHEAKTDLNFLFNGPRAILRRRNKQIA